MLFIIYLIIVFALVCLDQFSKFYIYSNFALNESINVINNFFDITYIQNFGAGFSILQHQRIFLSVVSILAICILSYLLYTTKKDDTVSKISYLLIIAGALGNLIDRIRLGYVVDFFDFVIFGYDFPVFNVADCYITIGCFIIIFIVLKESRNAKN